MKNQFINKLSFYIQRNTHNIGSRDFLCSILRVFLPKPDQSKGTSALDIDKSEGQILSEIEKEGISDLAFALSSDLMEKISASLKRLNCYDTAKNNAIVDPLSPSKDTQLAHYLRSDLSQIPEIISVANDPKVLNVVSRYFGAKPTISNINCWWSFGNRESAKEAQFFHRDLDDFKFLKLFFYLTDVTDENGPHIYVKNSHTANKLVELRRFSDEEVINTFGDSNIVTLIKDKGACFLEDTYGVHKGQLPDSGNRLLLQIQYSYYPLYVENYQPLQSDLVQKLQLDKYVNRLLFKS